MAENPTDSPCQALRSDLVTMHQKVGGEDFVVVKDQEGGSYFRFSATEYLLAEQFDGLSSLREIRQRLDENHDLEVAIADLAGFYHSLKDMGLLEKTGQERSMMLLEKRRAERQAKLLSMKGSLMFMRVPIVDPDAFFDKVLPYLRWIWTKSFVIMSSLFMLAACWLVMANWSRVLTGASAIYAFQGDALSTTLLLYATVLIVIAIHELGHGLTCKAFGGEVHEIGFLFLMFIPCMFANVNDAWMFPSKRHRLYVTAAGVYIEFLIGSIAVFVWYFTSQEMLINAIAYQTMAVCGLSTALFNFNPLMKLDGYYALSDILEIPNLKQTSTDYVSYWIKTRVMGVERDEKLEVIKTSTARIYLAYGVASIVYMACMLTGLFFVARMLLVGGLGGIGVAIWLYLGWFMVKKFGTGTYLFLKDYLAERRQLTQMIKMGIKQGVIGAVVGASLLLVFARVSDTVTADCTVAYYDKELLRAPVDGQVESIVQETDGTVTVTLINSDLSSEVEKQQLTVAELESQMRHAQVARDIADVHRLTRKVDAARQSLANLQADVHKLVIRSSVAGELSLSVLDSLNGKYVGKGEELLTVYDVSKVKALVDVNEQDIPRVHAGLPVRFVANSGWVREIFEGEVVEIYQDVIIDGARRLYQVDVAIRNDDGCLREGAKGTTKVYLGKISLLSYVYKLATRSLSADVKLLVNQLCGGS